MVLARSVYAIVAFLVNAYLFGCTVENLNILLCGKSIPDSKHLMFFGCALCLLTNPELMLQGISFTAVALMFLTSLMARSAKKQLKRRKPHQ